jgi:hypothetical protein
MVRIGLSWTREGRRDIRQHQQALTGDQRHRLRARGRACADDLCWRVAPGDDRRWLALCGIAPGIESVSFELQQIGLDLPFVAGAGAVVYVILFQRLSAAIGRLPVIRLSYSQPALWRAGKCFDELSQLARWFEGYTASAALDDLEVTLGLAITQNAKEFKEHYEELVERRQVRAAVWSRYYSGFCLLAFVSLILLAWLRRRGDLLLPGGLFVAAFIARCGWEAQIEAVALKRLRFAIDCAIVSGRKIQDESGA